jgi:hypothetical protein
VLIDHSSKVSVNYKEKEEEMIQGGGGGREPVPGWPTALGCIMILQVHKDTDPYRKIK